MRIGHNPLIAATLHDAMKDVMSVSDIDRSAIEEALAEFDQLGRKPFLDKYGFGTATTYLLRHNGHFYDPKAVAGVAHQYANGRPVLKPNEFDATQAVGRLEALGYEIVSFSGLWWVNQGQTYRTERDDGYIWAPQRTKAGYPVAHHTDVSRLRVGQRLIHYADNRIRAIGTVAEAPYEADRPAQLSSDSWDDSGYICPVDYCELETPILRTDIPDRGADVGPFDVNGNVKQGYLFRVSDAYLFPLLEFLNAQLPDFFNSPITHRHLLSSREVEAGPRTSDPILENLLALKNLVLEGVPGTGKTYAIEQVARQWKQRTGRKLLTFGGQPYCAIVLHPSSSYEDFIEGLRPGVGAAGGVHRMFDEKIDSSGQFGVADGVFVSVCAKAAASPDQDVLVLLDELNRCNVPSVFGDLLLTLEPSRRGRYVSQKSSQDAAARDWIAATPARLTYSGRTFFVPDNVYVIATTNTTDRSVAPLDSALRRRFAFHRLEPSMPDEKILPESVPGAVCELFILSAKVLSDLNEHVLRPCLGPDAMLGHSYLYAIADSLKTTASTEAGMNDLKLRWQYVIVPQLIDVVRSLGAEELLDSGTRDNWLAEHADVAESKGTATAALSQLDGFLQEALELQLVVEGTGLARGARIVRSPSAVENTEDTEQSETGSAEADG